MCLSWSIDRPVVIAARSLIPIGIRDLIGIGIVVIGIPHAWHIILALRGIIPIKEGIGLCHPDGILVVCPARTGSIVEGLQIAISPIREIAVSFFWTSSMVDAVGFKRISRYAAAATAHAYSSHRLAYHQKQCY